MSKRKNWDLQRGARRMLPLDLPLHQTITLLAGSLYNINWNIERQDKNKQVPIFSLVKRRYLVSCTQDVKLCKSVCQYDPSINKRNLQFRLVILFWKQQLHAKERQDIEQRIKSGKFVFVRGSMSNRGTSKHWLGTVNWALNAAEIFQLNHLLISIRRTYQRLNVYIVLNYGKR